jgi:hypothetical protein
MSKLITALLNFALAATTRNIQVGVISDCHLNTAYNSLKSENLCTGIDVTTPAPNAPLGRYGCDSNEALIDLMFTRFKDTFGEVDFIIVPGDSIAHKVAAA